MDDRDHEQRQEQQGQGRKQEQAHEQPPVGRTPAAVPRCRHCGVRAAHAGRGMCRVCYEQPGVRHAYADRRRVEEVDAGGDREGRATRPAQHTAKNPKSTASIIRRVNRELELERVRAERDALYRHVYGDKAFLPREVPADGRESMLRRTGRDGCLPPDVYRVVTPPPAPTRHLPGTEGKVLVLQERARLGQALWHPLDAGWGIRCSNGLWTDDQQGGGVLVTYEVLEEDRRGRRMLDLSMEHDAGENTSRNGRDPVHPLDRDQPGVKVPHAKTPNSQKVLQALEMRRLGSRERKDEGRE